MTRQILFRGKRTDNGEWIYWDVYGRICTIKGKETRAVRKKASGERYYYHVIEIKQLLDLKTITQYVRLPDKNGRKIFDGDIVRVLLSWDGNDVMDIGRVFYSEELCGFYRTSKVFDGCPSMIYADKYEVIGNIYDNPELIGEKTND